VYGARPDMVNRALQQQRRRLLKLHGDWEERTDRILTKSQYEKHYGSADATKIDFSLPLPRLLKHVLTGRALLFLGCSLNQDRTVRVLESVAREATEIAHFAVLELPPSAVKRRAKMRFLSDHNIRPIWYPSGCHDMLEPILEYLVRLFDFSVGRKLLTHRTLATLALPGWEHCVAVQSRCYLALPLGITASTWSGQFAPVAFRRETLAFLRYFVTTV